MADSLLAHLYTHIRGSQEDIATLSLQYILTKSEELQNAFTKRVASHLNVKLGRNIHYVTQVSGKNRERPDFAGISPSGKEVVLCEMKFYAGLTANQPLAYLDRLAESDGKGLLFICPQTRVISLWNKLKDACAARQLQEIDDYCVSVDGIHMAIATWPEILELLTKTAASVAVDLLADIRQLEGYCSQMDSDAFIPFQQEELTAETAKRAERYYEVIDQTIKLLCSDDDHETSLKGLKATGYRHGYTRSLYIDGYAITLNYDRTLWKNSGTVETPFWVAIREDDWTQSDYMIDRMQHYPPHRRETTLWSLTFMALEPLTDAPLMEVCDDLKQQITDYLSYITES